MKKVLLASFSRNPDFKIYFDSLRVLKNEPDVLFLPDEMTQMDVVKRGIIWYVQKFVKFFQFFYSNRNSIDSVWLDSPSVLNIPAILVARFFYKKVCVSIHDIRPHPGRKAWMSSVYNKICISLVEIIVVGSEFSRECFLNLYGNRRVVVRNLAGLGEPLPSAGSSDQALWFGRGEDYKGLELLEDCCRELSESGSEIKILVAGQGVSRFFSGESMHLSNLIVRDHFISESDLDRELSRSFCCILPYTSATQSGVAARSLGAGVPVIASRVGALPEQIVDGKNGIFMDELSSEGLSDGLRTLHADQKMFREESLSLSFLYSKAAYVEGTNRVLKLLT